MLRLVSRRALRAPETFLSFQVCPASGANGFAGIPNTFVTGNDMRTFTSHSTGRSGQESNGFTRRPSDSRGHDELRTLPDRLRPIQGETLDLILRQKVYLLQSRRGYRANVDSHILAYFASDVCDRQQRRSEFRSLRVLDLGAGNGLVSILFAKAQQPCKVHLIELQPQLADRARRNLDLNDIQGIVTTLDLQGGILPQHLCGNFDVVLINPPFYPEGSRKPPRMREKFLAHMETTASISDFLSAASSACDTQNPDAFVALIHDRKELPRLQKAFSENNLEAYDSREMLHTADEEPSRILIQLKLRRTSSRYQHGPNYCAEQTGGRKTKFSSKVEIEIPSLPPVVLHSNPTSQSTYTKEIEVFLEKLPLPSLRIGRLRDVY